VLYALRYPFSFGVLVVAFLLGLCVRGFAQRLVSGQRRPAWARKLTRRRSLLWLKPFVDPYGMVAAAVGGPGWGAPVEAAGSLGRPSGRALGQLLAGPIAVGALGVVALEGFRAWTGDVPVGAGWLSAVYHGGAFVGPQVTTGLSTVSDPHFHYVIGFGQVALFLAGVEWLTMGVLAIMPLPPLDGGRLLFAVAPRTIGWQRARFRLDDENWGALVLLVLALPVLFRVPLLLTLLGYIVDPLVRLVA
jgi:hypothetical protein